VVVLMMMLMIIRKISSGHHGCIHFLKQASLFNASFMLMLIRANAICTAWIAWTVPFVLFVFHSTVTIELFRYVQSAKDFIHHSYKVAIHTHKHCSHHEALFLLPEIYPCLSSTDMSKITWICIGFSNGMCLFDLVCSILNPWLFFNWDKGI
jgi:hypothetical protein